MSGAIGFSHKVFRDDNTEGYSSEQLDRLNSIVENLAAVSTCEDRDDLQNLAERAERIFEQEQITTHV